jgi:hypothetical protein
MLIGGSVPSGFLTVCHGKSQFLRTVNHLFLWAIYTMAMLVITRGYIPLQIHQKRSVEKQQVMLASFSWSECEMEEFLWHLE